MEVTYNTVVVKSNNYWKWAMFRLYLSHWRIITKLAHVSCLHPMGTILWLVSQYICEFHLFYFSNFNTYSVIIYIPTHCADMCCHSRKILHSQFYDNFPCESFLSPSLSPTCSHHWKPIQIFILYLEITLPILCLSFSLSFPLLPLTLLCSEIYWLQMLLQWNIVFRVL